MHQISKIKGFNDLWWPESAKYTFMEATAGTVFSRYGYREIRVPVLEKTELFARSIGEDTDIVQKEMFTFADRKDRLLTLRPEATAGVARAYLDDTTRPQGQICKVYTCGPMFRYERPQKGRQRQFHQVNAELFGSASPCADAELIAMLWRYLHELGLVHLDLHLNSLGCPQCRPEFSRRLQEYLAEQALDALCPDCRRRKETNPLRVLDCKVPGCQKIAENAPNILDHLCSECRDHFSSVQNILQACSIPYVLNHRLVRGLDYYQRTTFEVMSRDIGAQSSVAGGGRYDGLLEQLGGPPCPGIGFACGMERLAMLLDPPPAPPPDFYLAVLDPAALDQGQILALGLREQGLRGEVSFEAKGPKPQLRLANKQGAAYCILLGREELESQTVVVKDMHSGEQRTLPQSGLSEALGRSIP
ncbi:histidine--tRNA ligase [Desulfovermiculus halophilus]|jgi:histidyl-tRNA synthetase|uniref:histidine--tRNA ligase n=1 Tax=Desulfovermiculus halophilus TaxID=339722 RepID=UPI00048708E0|nr:histidine--tRNA ligase [Desulfovermiculus halophilus]